MTVSVLGLGVALAGAVGWAALDATRKGLVERADPEGAAAWVNLAQGPIFVAWALVAADAELSSAYWPVGLASLGLQAAANALLFRALSVSPLSATIPFLSLTPVFTSIVALSVHGEVPSAWQWAGIGIVVVGALAVHAGGERGLLRNLREERGSWMAVAVAALWSVTSNLDKLALEHASLPLHAAVQSGGVGVLLVGWMLARGRAAHLRIGPSARLPLAGAVGFAFGALALQLWAIQLLFVGLVETIKRAVGVASAVVVGRALFGEAITPAKVVATVALALGTALLILG